MGQSGLVGVTWSQVGPRQLGQVGPRGAKWVKLGQISGQMGSSGICSERFGILGGKWLVNRWVSHMFGERKGLKRG